MSDQQSANAVSRHSGESRNPASLTWISGFRAVFTGVTFFRRNDEMKHSLR